MRKLARETAFKLIFEYLFLKEKNQTSINELCGGELLTDADREYINIVYSGVIENYDSIYGEISKLSFDFKPERIFKVDLAILLLSIYEIKYMADVPDIVAINEAVELAKIYSTDKSHSFINGILASYFNNKNNGDINDIKEIGGVNEIKEAGDVNDIKEISDVSEIKNINEVNVINGVKEVKDVEIN